jgi:hypothetical protein
MTRQLKLVVMVLAIAGAFYSTGCDKPVCDCPAFPNGDTVTVSISEKVNVYSCCDDRFSITFKNVKEDSRCPEGFNCHLIDYVGTARISVKINGLQHVDLEITNPAVVNSGGHEYTLLLTELTPYPKSGLPTDPSTYNAKIVVSRN